LTIFLIFITLSQNFCSLAERRSRRASRRSKQIPNNKWVQLLYGILAGMTGNDVAGQVNQCLPEEWKGPDDSLAGGDPAGGSGESATIKTILDAISKVINTVCQFKEDIKKLFDKKLKLYNRKLFLQKMEKYKKRGFGSSFKKAAGSISKAASSAAKTVVNTAKKAGNAVASAAKAGFDAVKNLALKIIDKVKALFAKIKALIEKLVTEIIPKVEKMITCLQALGADAQQVVTIMKGIYDKITTIISGGGAGLAKVFVDLVCQFDTFRQAVETLITAIKEPDTMKKFNGYGRFTGLVLKAIGSKRFRKMKMYNI